MEPSTAGLSAAPRSIGWFHGAVYGDSVRF